MVAEQWLVPCFRRRATALHAQRAGGAEGPDADVGRALGGAKMIAASQFVFQYFSLIIRNTLEHSKRYVGELYFPSLEDSAATEVQNPPL